METLLAFFSGAALVLVVHYFTVRRKKLEMWDSEYALFDAAKEELRYALRELEFLRSGIREGKDGLRFAGYFAQPAFRSSLVRKMGPNDPISPRIIVTLSALFDDVEAIGARFRSGHVTSADVVFLERTQDYALSVFAAYGKAQNSLAIPASTSITEADLAEARARIGFLASKSS
jgi:hypothetical protein